MQIDGNILHEIAGTPRDKPTIYELEAFINAGLGRFITTTYFDEAGREILNAKRLMITEGISLEPTDMLPLCLLQLYRTIVATRFGEPFVMPVIKWATRIYSLVELDTIRGLSDTPQAFAKTIEESCRAANTSHPT